MANNLKAPLTGASYCGNETMKIFSESNFARVCALASVLVLGALGPQTLYSSSLDAEITRHLLIQGSNIERLVDLVESTGGTVNRELSVLNAVGVEVTPSQLEVISRSVDVHRILDDRQASVGDLEGSYWTSVGDLEGSYWTSVGDLEGSYWT
jgi:hypothetical protein